jgi:putative oxidoreductase
MSTTIATLDRHRTAHDDITAAAHAERYVVLAGRLLFATIFLIAPLGHFNSQTVGYAAQQGVPAAGLLVPASGLVALAGALSIALGYRARIGAWLLVAFIVPVTITMHNFWAVSDPMMHQMQLAMFLKNVSMLGGALLIAHFGAGPLSLDARRARASLP